MAQEISMNVAIAVLANGVAAGASHNQLADHAGPGLLKNVQNIGTSAELLVVGDVSPVKKVYVRNMDTTNYVEVALDSGMTNKFAKLEAGDWMWLPASTGTLYLRANTAAVNVETLVL